MRTVLRLLLTAAIVMVLAEILPGVEVAGYASALAVAVILALLRIVVKPILIFLTLPITIITFGLFLLFINAIIILMAAYVVNSFEVSSIWWALLFSLLLSLFQSILFSILDKPR